MKKNSEKETVLSDKSVNKTAAASAATGDMNAAATMLLLIAAAIAGMVAIRICRRKK